MRIPAGPLPRRSASARMALPPLEPRPPGIISMRSATLAPSCGWRRSMIVPEAGSSPPQKLKGSSSSKGAPAAAPATSVVALNAAVLIAAPPCRRAPKDDPDDCSSWPSGDPMHPVLDGAGMEPSLRDEEALIEPGIARIARLQARRRAKILIAIVGADAARDR